MSRPDPRQFGGAGIAPGYDGPCEQCGKPGRSMADPHGRPVAVTLCEDCESDFRSMAAPLQWLALMLVLVALGALAWWIWG